MHFFSIKDTNFRRILIPLMSTYNYLFIDRIRQKFAFIGDIIINFAPDF